MSDATPTPQHAEVNANFIVFMAERAALMETDRGRFAVYRNGIRVAIVDTFRDAISLINATGGFPASAQEITDQVEYCYAN